MKKVRKYDDYCLLLSRIESKKTELSDIINKKGTIQMELDGLNNELKSYADISNMSVAELSAIQSSRIRNCFNSTIHFEEGGAITESPMQSFKESKEDGYNSLDYNQKKLFKLIESRLEDKQYSIQNALSLLRHDNEEIDIYETPVIEDFIDNFMEEMDNYNTLNVKDLKEIKKIIYIFVKNTSKL